MAVAFAHSGLVPSIGISFVCILSGRASVQVAPGQFRLVRATFERYGCFALMRFAWQSLVAFVPIQHRSGLG